MKRVALLLIGAVWCAPRVSAEPAKGLEIRNFTFNPSLKLVEYDIANTSGKRITDYLLVRYVTPPSGPERKIPTPVHLGFAPLLGSMPPVQARVNVQFPGGVLHRRDHLRVAGPVKTARIEIEAVIFFDGTSSGDEHWIALVFRQRKSAADEYVKWLPRVQALRKSKKAYDDAKALYNEIALSNYEAEKARFDAAIDAEDTSVTSARQAVQNVLREVASLAKEGAGAEAGIGYEIDQFAAEAETNINAAKRR